MVFFYQAASAREAGVRALGRALGVDLRRSLLSGAFFLTVALMLAWMCFNSAHYLFNPAMWSQISAPKMLFNATCTSLGLAPLLLPSPRCPTPGASSRTGRAALRIRRWNGWASGPMALPRSCLWPCRPSWRRRCPLACSWGRFSCWVCRKLSPPWKGEGYLGFAASGHTVGYYLARITITGLSCSLASVFGLMMTAIIRNVFCGAAGASGGILFVLGPARGCEPCDPPFGLPRHSG